MTPETCDKLAPLVENWNQRAGDASEKNTKTPA